MRVNSGMRQTYGRSVAVAGLETGLSMDYNSELISDNKAHLTINNKTDSKLRPKISFVDIVMHCLEEEETLAEQLIGYGVCALAILYLLGSLARAVF